MDIYTDGSYNKKATTDASGWSVVAVRDETPEEFVCDIYYGVITDPSYTKMWNVGGEVYAALYGIDVVDRIYKVSQLRIFHDYYGLLAWANGSWQAKNPTTRDYRDFVRRQRENRSIAFHHVKGHSGNQLNEVADHYAGKGIQEYLERKTTVNEILGKHITKGLRFRG